MILGLHWLDVVVLGAFLCLMTGIGLRSARGVKSSEELFIGKRRFSIPFMIFHAFGAGTHTDQAAQVTGKAASEPLYPDDPEQPANRRISIVLLREAPVLPADHKL